jgi:penicillin-binding protein 2
MPPGLFSLIEQAMTGTVVGEGTAAAAFAGFPLDRVQVAGKSGTAQMKPRQPFAWFSAIAKDSDREVVVVALVEEAGSGSQIAAPIVRQVIAEHFGLDKGNVELGERAD